MRRFLGFLALVCAVLTLAAPAFAQDRTGTWEISPFAGGFLGGRLYGSSGSVGAASGSPGNPLLASSSNDFLREDDDLAYGARLAYNVTRHFGIEVDWTSSRTDLRTPNFFGFVSRDLKVGTLRQDIYEANALFNFGRRRAIGYVVVGAGSAVERRDIPGVNPQATGHFTASLGVGGKFFFTPRIGLRIEGRYRAIDLTDSSDDMFDCNHNGSCTDRRRANWSYNAEATGGLVVAF